MSSGKDFVHGVLAPLVATIASPEADALAKLNGLHSIAELLRPFGDRVGQAQVYDVQMHAYMVDRFQVRFRDIRQLESYGSDVIHRTVLAYLRDRGKDKPSLPVLRDKDDVPPNGKVAELTPWYTDYRNCVCKYTGISEHETFNHPVAYLCVVSTTNPDPIAAAQQLVGEIQSMHVTERPYLDPAIPKYFLLLHDSFLAPHVNAEAVLLRLKNFAPNSFLARINSIPHSPVSLTELHPSETPPARAVPDIWTGTDAEFQKILEQLEIAARRTSMASVASGKDSLMSPITDEGFPIYKERNEQQPATAGGLPTPGHEATADIPFFPPAGFLTQEDVNALDMFTRSLVTQKLIKHMEACMQQWNEQVAANRRTLTGRLNRLGMKYFGGSGKAQGTSPVPVTDKTGTMMFPHNAPEMVMRRLADFAFMLRDYRLAFQTYDLVRKDFQNNDKLLKYHAGTQELLGLTSAISEGVGKGSLETYLDAAVAGYTDSNASLYSTRAAMLHYEILAQKGLIRDAAPLLIRMTGEDSDLRSALFLEQAAMLFLQVQPPMVRKYAFHLILAGHRFSKCGQRIHAFRCYNGARAVYNERDWALVEDHINFTLGRQSFHLGDFQSAVGFFLKLLRASRQSQMQQSAYLREFLYLYGYAAKASEQNVKNLPALPIPIIDLWSTNVSLLEAHSGQPKQVANMDETWETMENELFEDGFKKSGLLQPTLSLANKGKTTCAVGEPVFVTFEVRNPMDIPIQINNVHLECSFGGGPPIVSDLRWIADSQSPLKVEHPQYDVENIPEVALGDREKKQVQLRIFPKQEGEIRILGIRYTLCGVVPTTREFPAKGKGGKDVVSQLSLTVTSPMPVLDVIFHSFPTAILSGQVSQVVLEINNKGNRGLRNLQLKTSHPSFFSVGNNDGLDAPVYGQVDAETAGMFQETMKCPNLLFNLGTTPFQLPIKEGQPNDEERVLGAGMTTIIPLWIRGDKVGKQNFRFLFGYQSEDKRDKTSYRTLRYSVSANVLPSLRINAFTRPSGKTLDEFILGIEIENLRTEGDLVLRQLSSISPTWAIHPIASSQDSAESFRVGSQQVAFKYYRFKRASSAPVDHASIPEILTLRAIERLLLNETSIKLNAPDLDLYVSSLGLQSGTAVSCNTIPFRGLTANSRLQWRLTYLQSLYPGLTPKQLRELFTFYFTDDVDLSLVWSLPDGRISGHQYVMGINLGMQAPLQGLQAGLEPLATAAKAAAGKALFETTVREKRALITSLLKSRGRDNGPMRVILKAGSEFQHDFDSGVCIVPISVELRNTSWANAANYHLRIAADLDTNVDSKGDQSKPEPGREIDQSGRYFIGSTSISGSLKPEEETTLTFNACFGQPGVYDVNKWHLNVSIEPLTAKRNEGVEGTDSKATSYVQTPSLPHWVTVLGR
ncbi:ER-golgi trafficking TRAPP I complex 85 kDa subunit-domain-containing protein [Fimicolochytrium jonesii]|uniref:ER-golgi trafficking TRAPP I complex 85 kDa subunit-domain-containing protein n=1 Tax=Fimicolochytrium jonesii TaxID=1396493 RepID=UPI0022FF3C28|nr:ER-golgi trafficking TRAPP I complex 85 kDa subunit-domain-containing protein [Fimicolochytrium jonesii]KAI8819635.1 ER-golgi trafficking TRAPP I complex 85 kDa subunit-domain-containing protein [Fimicolochytrium jonesii]